MAGFPIACLFCLELLCLKLLCSDLIEFPVLMTEYGVIIPLLLKELFMSAGL